MNRSAFLILCASLAALGQVDFKREGNNIQVSVDGKPFTEFFMGPEAPRPYLHPLRAASGKIVTRRYPMEKVAGEPTDHEHHRGVWFGFQDVNHVNFWANEFSYAPKQTNLGKIVLKQVDSMKGGKRSGTIVATFDWRGPKNELVLTEKRTMTFFADPKLRTIDFDFLLIPNGKVTFYDEKDGAFAVRVHPGIQEEKSVGTLVNDQGVEKEKNVWGKPSKWMDYHGVVEGEKLGIAIFDHPENLRHPQRWHARGYGLFAVNPFCLAMFTGDKTKPGDYTIAADQTLRLRYRLVVHPDDTKTAGIADLYEKYTKRK
jgi:hypothetical protein